MHQPEHSSPTSLRFLAVGVLCVAVVLGGYFVQLNAKADRQREEAADDLVRLGQDAFGHPLSQRFQKIETLCGKFRRDGLGQAVIGQDLVHIIIQRLRLGADFDHDIELDALGGYTPATAQGYEQVLEKLGNDLAGCLESL